MTSLSSQLEKQSDILRLIMQKMDINTEADQDEGLQQRPTAPLRGSHPGRPRGLVPNHAAQRDHQVRCVSGDPQDDMGIRVERGPCGCGRVNADATLSLVTAASARRVASPSDDPAYVDPAARARPADVDSAARARPADVDPAARARPADVDPVAGAPTRRAGSQEIRSHEPAVV